MSDIVKNIPLSRNTVSRRIQDISDQIKNNLKRDLQAAKYVSISLDESTDRTSISQLLVFIRFVDDKFNVKEALLNCYPMHGTCKANDILLKVEEAIAEFSLEQKLIAICTDGAPVMTGKRNGLVGLLKSKGFDIPSYHCIIHQENLCSKSIKLNDTMDIVIKVLSKLKAGHNALTHRQLKVFLEEYDAEYKDLVLFTEVRWLSRGNCLKRFFELRKEIVVFAKMTNKFSAELITKLESSDFNASLAFLTDIFGYLNLLNLSLQENKQNIFELLSSVDGFKKKLEILKTNLSNNNLSFFECCQTVSKEALTVDFKQFIICIDALINEFVKRFVDFTNVRNFFEIYANPLHCEISKQPSEYQMELCDIQNDINLKYLKESGIIFWKQVPIRKYPKLIDKMLIFSAMFGSTYNCESTFSIMKHIKNEYRSRLTDQNLENLLRISVNEDKIDFKNLIYTELNE